MNPESFLLTKTMESENENSNLTASSSDSNTMPSSSQSTGEDDEPDVYYFESDHLALKGNKDYQRLLRTICLLEAQRAQATKDLEKLIDCEKEALADPIKFVEKLQNQVDIGLPEPLRVAPLPAIEWERYTSSVDPLNLAVRKHMTRKRHGPDPKSSDAGQFGSHNLLTVIKQEPKSAAGSDTEAGQQVVRGRVKDENKSETFNQLWTAEEQQRLEELLIIYQPEPVEARRWAKIAEALGNRTAQQVASRVQKYFIRLAKAGLPIPGRMPNINSHVKKSSAHRHQRYNRMYYQPSTFLQSVQPPVYMPETDTDHYRYPGAPSRQNMDDISDEEDIPPEKRLTVEYQELLRLKQLRRKKLREQSIGEHIGYKCDQCSCEPIVGTRWHCVDCPEEVSVDFCDECMDCQYENGTHQTFHKLEPVYITGGKNEVWRGGGGEKRHVDRDYLQGTQQGHYNYLDPNYMPAS